MGRERALAAEPSTDAAAVQAAIDDAPGPRGLSTRPGRPAGTLPDVRPALDRCGAPTARPRRPELVADRPRRSTPRSSAPTAGARAPVAPAWPPSPTPCPASPTSPTASPRPRRRRRRDRRREPRRSRLRQEIRDAPPPLVAGLERCLPGHGRRPALRRPLRHGPPRPVRAARCGPRRAAACAASSTTARRAARRSSSSPRASSTPTTTSSRRRARKRHEIARILAELTDAVRARLADLDGRWSTPRRARLALRARPRRRADGRRRRR